MGVGVIVNLLCNYFRATTPTFQKFQILFIGKIWKFIKLKRRGKPKYQIKERRN